MDLSTIGTTGTGSASQRPERRELRACANCSHAKARCVPSEDPGGRCQRCERLHKICEPTAARVRPPARKRKSPETTRVSKSHVEKLEEKLDGLVTLIKSTQENGAPAAVAPFVSSSSISTTQTPSNSSTKIPQQPISDFQVREQVQRWEDNFHFDHKTQPPAPSSTSPYTIHPAESNSIEKSSPENLVEVDEVDLGSDDPDELLAIFRNEMSPSFPFITMTEFTRAEDLRRDRPCLYTAILAVTTRNTPRSKALGKAFMKQLAERMLVNGERNMDLLLGCLTYAAWFRDLINNGNHITSLLGCAMTIASDLGLNRPTFSDTPGFFEHAIRSFHGIPDFKESPGTLEERRAFLGYFYLTSVFCGFGRRLETLPWTPYLEECCRILNASGSSRQDKSAVMLARIQMVAQRIGQNPWEGRQDFSGNAPPPLLYLKSLQNQIQKLREEMDPILEEETIVTLTHHNADVLSHKIGLSKSPAVSSFPDRDFNRLQYLCTCLAAVKSVLEVYVSIPVEKYHTVTVPMIMQLTWNSGTLQLLSTFEHPDWDLSFVTEAIDFFQFMKTMIEKMGSVKGILGFDLHTTEPLDFFSQSAKTIGLAQAFFEGKVVDHACGDLCSQDHRNMGTPNFGNFAPGAEFMDLMDDVWMRDALGPMEY